MKYFISTSGELFAFEDDGSQDHLIGTDLRPALPEEVSAIQAPAPAPIAPISPRQIRMALTRAGLRADVEAAVAAGDQDLKDWWEFSTTFERNNAQVDAMAAALGQTTEQVDALWQLGATL